MPKNKLQKYLKDTGITQAKFARKARTTQGFVSLIIAGKKKPGGGLSLRIERATGGAVTCQDLLK